MKRNYCIKYWRQPLRRQYHVFVHYTQAECRNTLIGLGIGHERSEYIMALIRHLCTEDKSDGISGLTVFCPEYWLKVETWEDRD